MYDGGYLNNFNNQNNNLNNLNNRNCFNSYFRVLNAIVDADSLDVYVNEMLIASELKYGEFSMYMQYAPGNYRVAVYMSGRKREIIFETIINIGINLAYTGVLSGEMSDIFDLSIFMIPESKEKRHMEFMSAVKFINLSIDTPPLDLITGDGTILFSGIEYGTTTENVALPAGTYTLHLRETNSHKNILTVPNLDFAPRMHYTLFSIGKYEETPKIEMIIPVDGINYLDLC